MPAWKPADWILLRAGVQFAPADGERWQVRWDFDEVAFLEGAAWRNILPWLLPLLAVPTTYDGILGARPRHCSRADLDEALGLLEQRGFLRAENGPPPDRELDDVIRALAADPETVRKRLGRATVPVCGRSPLARRTATAIEEHGLAVTLVDSLEPLRAAADEALPVVVETDWTEKALLDANESSPGARRNWLLLGAWSRRVLIGPLFVAGESACYACYRGRLDSHRRHLEAYRQFRAARDVGGPAAPAEPLLPGLAALAAGWCAMEVFGHIAAIRPSRLAGRVLIYDPETQTLAREAVLRLPWCASCGGPKSPGGGS